MKTNRKMQGFTILELMISTSVFFIMTAVAVPSMNGFFDKRRVVEAAEDLYSNLQLARTEAIARSVPVYLRFNSTGGNWQYGISQNNLCDLTKTDPTVANANACLLVVDDGDGTIDDGSATVDSGDTILHRFTNNDYTNVSMTLTAMPNVNNQIEFDPTRGMAENATITLQSEEGLQMRIIVGLLGQVRLCSPAGISTYVTGYTSDGC